MTELVDFVVAIDPGDRHVGVALFCKVDDVWCCEDAYQTEPAVFLRWLSSVLSSDSTRSLAVVYEQFRLYADAALSLTGSTFETAQMIGVIRFLVETHNEGRGFGASVLLVEQRADVKKPTAGVLRALGLSLRARAAKRKHPGWGDHAVDAELHGAFFILRTLGGRLVDDDASG